MSLIQPQQLPEKRLSPGLTLNLSSNNPFRKGANSPSLSPGLVGTPTERPVSRNPFLDQPTDMDGGWSQGKASNPVGAVNGSSAINTDQAADMFNSMSILDKTATDENLPPQVNGKAGHRITRSENPERHQKGGDTMNTSDVLDIFADPIEIPKSHDRRPRHNSESSVTERNGKPLEPEEERRRRERRRREVRHRERDSSGRPIPSAGPRGKKPSHRLDVIDKLDVTSIYGTGLFHHDGPFDACNPHRNRKGSQRAPMQAFPKDSANNVIGGSGPVNKGINLAQFHGRDAEGFTDYSASGKTGALPFEPYAGAAAPIRGDAKPGIDRTSNFNPIARAEIHGDETMGLGTSTFLEGAPAARVAIRRRESDSEAIEGGLSRKRSLAQKIRGISNARVGSGARGVNSPEPIYEQTTSPIEQHQSAAGPGKKETNPFFNEYDEEYEKKGANIKIAEERNKVGEDLSGSGKAVSSPVKAERTVNPLQRALTADGPASSIVEEPKSGGGGFLSRVKSLRGVGRGKPRVERRETSS